MDPLVFRNARADDAEAIVALVESAYRGDASRAGWTTEADLLDGNRIDPDVLRGDILRPGSRVLLAERDGILLGCAHVGIEDDAGYFGMFAVRPDLQGAKLGRTMLEAAERYARDLWRVPAMYMTVINLREDLIAYYERRGYRRTGEQKPFPFADGIEAAFKAEYPAANIVGRFLGGTAENGQQSMETALQKFPDITGVLGINDAGNLGAYQALKAAGKGPDDVFIFGIDCEPQAVDLIKAGDMYRGCVDTNPKGTGELAASAVALYAAGGTVPGVVTVPVIVFTG